MKLAWWRHWAALAASEFRRLFREVRGNEPKSVWEFRLYSATQDMIWGHTKQPLSIFRCLLDAELKWVSWLTPNSQDLNIRWHWSGYKIPRSSHLHNIASICDNFTSSHNLKTEFYSTDVLNIELSWLTTFPLYRNAVHQTGIAMYQFCCGRLRNFVTAIY